MAKCVCNALEYPTRATIFPQAAALLLSNTMDDVTLDCFLCIADVIFAGLALLASPNSPLTRVTAIPPVPSASGEGAPMRTAFVCGALYKPATGTVEELTPDVLVRFYKPLPAAATATVGPTAATDGGGTSFRPTAVSRPSTSSAAAAPAKAARESAMLAGYASGKEPLRYDVLGGVAWPKVKLFSAPSSNAAARVSAARRQVAVPSTVGGDDDGPGDESSSTLLCDVPRETLQLWAQRAVPRAAPLYTRPPTLLWTRAPAGVDVDAYLATVRELSADLRVGVIVGAPVPVPVLDGDINNISGVSKKEKDSGSSMRRGAATNLEVSAVRSVHGMLAPAVLICWTLATSTDADAPVAAVPKSSQSLALESPWGASSSRQLLLPGSPPAFASQSSNNNSRGAFAASDSVSLSPHPPHVAAPPGQAFVAFMNQSQVVAVPLHSLVLGSPQRLVSDEEALSELCGVDFDVAAAIARVRDMCNDKRTARISAPQHGTGLAQTPQSTPTMALAATSAAGLPAQGAGLLPVATASAAALRIPGRSLWSSLRLMTGTAELAGVPRTDAEASIVSAIHASDLDTWSPDAQLAFARGLNRFGKLFHLIAQIVPGKSRCEAVSFYFRNKHTRMRLAGIGWRSLNATPRPAAQRTAAVAAAAASAAAGNGADSLKPKDGAGDAADAPLPSTLSSTGSAAGDVEKQPEDEKSSPPLSERETNDVAMVAAGDGPAVSAGTKRNRDGEVLPMQVPVVMATAVTASETPAAAMTFVDPDSTAAGSMSTLATLQRHVRAGHVIVATADDVVSDAAHVAVDAQPASLDSAVAIGRPLASPTDHPLVLSCSDGVAVVPAFVTDVAPEQQFQCDEDVTGIEVIEIDDDDENGAVDTPSDDDCVIADEDEDDADEREDDVANVIDDGQLSGADERDSEDVTIEEAVDAAASTIASWEAIPGGIEADSAACDAATAATNDISNNRVGSGDASGLDLLTAESEDPALALELSGNAVDSNDRGITMLTLPSESSAATMDEVDSAPNVGNAAASTSTATLENVSANSTVALDGSSDSPEVVLLSSTTTTAATHPEGDRAAPTVKVSFQAAVEASESIVPVARVPNASTEASSREATSLASAANSARGASTALALTSQQQQLLPLPSRRALSRAGVTSVDFGSGVTLTRASGAVAQVHSALTVAVVMDRLRMPGSVRERSSAPDSIGELPDLLSPSSAAGGSRFCGECKRFRLAGQVLVCCNPRCGRTGCDVCFRKKISAFKSQHTKPSWKISRNNSWWMCFHCCPPLPSASESAIAVAWFSALLSLHHTDVSDSSRSTAGGPDGDVIRPRSRQRVGGVSTGSGTTRPAPRQQQQQPQRLVVSESSDENDEGVADVSDGGKRGTTRGGRTVAVQLRRAPAPAAPTALQRNVPTGVAARNGAAAGRAMPSAPNRSSNGAIAAAPGSSLSRGTVTTASAIEYIRAVRAFFGPGPGEQNFLQLMMFYKQGKINGHELVDRVVKLFREASAPQALLDGFFNFVPRSAAAKHPAAPQNTGGVASTGRDSRTSAMNAASSGARTTVNTQGLKSTDNPTNGIATASAMQSVSQSAGASALQRPSSTPTGAHWLSNAKRLVLPPPFARLTAQSAAPAPAPKATDAPVSGTSSTSSGGSRTMSAVEYIRAVRAFLPAGPLSAFMGVMHEYRERTVTAEVLIRRVLDIFRDNGAPQDLIDNFMQFAPRVASRASR